MTKDANFTCDAKILRNAMRYAGWVAAKRTTIPILEKCRIDAFNGGINVAVTDLENYLTFRLDADGGSGKMLVPVHQLAATLKGFEGPVTVGYSGDQISGVNGGMRFKHATVAVEDFPDHPEESETVATLEMNLDEFGWAMQQCEPAISDEPTRYYLNGIHLGFDRRRGKGALRCVSTDGHRMNVCTFPDAKSETVEKFNAIIPAATVKMLIRLLLASDKDAPMTITQTATRIIFKGPFWRLVSKMIDGTFPDYQRVMPLKKNAKIRFKADGAMLGDVAGRLAAATDKRAISLDLSPSALRAYVSSGDGSAASEAMDVDYEGPAIVFGLNGRYLQTAMGLIEDRALVFISDASSPLLIHDADEPDFEQVIMPVRVDAQGIKSLPAPKPEKAAKAPKEPKAPKAKKPAAPKREKSAPSVHATA